MTLACQTQPVTVLLATDGSSHSRSAARWLTTLRLPSGSRVVVLAVAYLLHLAARADLYLTFREREAHEIEATLRQALATLGQAGIQAEPTIRSGHPADVIIGTAADSDADLIVLGARGSTAEPMLPIGGVAQKVIKYTRQPVLVVRPSARGWRLLLATDGSPAADKALDFLTRWPWPPGVTVTVLHVRSTVVSPWLRGITALGKEGQSMAEVEGQARAQAMVDRAVEKLNSVGLPADGQVLVGDPATEILHLARQTGADLILLGDRGQSAVRRFLLGSVSHKVAHYAPCSVLVVK